jgi:hypothetical protein
METSEVKPKSPYIRALGDIAQAYNTHKTGFEKVRAKLGESIEGIDLTIEQAVNDNNYEYAIEQERVLKGLRIIFPYAQELHLENNIMGPGEK